MKNLICRIWNNKTENYGATFITCKKHFDMTSKALKEHSYDGHIEKIGESGLNCEECRYRRHAGRHTKRKK